MFALLKIISKLQPLGYPELYEHEKPFINKMMEDLDPDESIAFIGSGGIPIVPIWMAKDYGRKIVCYDADPEVANISSTNFRLLGMHNLLSINNIRGENADFSNHAAVFVANAPLSQKGLIDHVLSFPNIKHVIIRSADGIQQLMFPSIKEEDIASEAFDVQSMKGSSDKAYHTLMHLERK